MRREILTEELLDLPQTVATLVDVVAQQRQDFKALATDVRGYMERTITLIGEGFTAVRSETSGLRTDTEAGFTAVGAEISQLRTDTEAGFTAVRSEISELRTAWRRASPLSVRSSIRSTPSWA